MFGEIGTSQEEAAAALIESGEFTKPLIAYIGGKAAKSGTPFSHAGAIIEGDRGTHASKVARLREVGAHIVESFADIPRVTANIVQPRKVVPVSKPQTDEDHAICTGERRLPKSAEWIACVGSAFTNSWARSRSVRRSISR